MRSPLSDLEMRSPLCDSEMRSQLCVSEMRSPLGFPETSLRDESLRDEEPTR